MSQSKILIPSVLTSSTLIVALVACAPNPVSEAVSVAPAADAPAPIAASMAAEEVVAVENAAAQIAAAVTAAPADRRDAAAVRGFTAGGELVLLRAGTNDLACLADTPGDERFQVACYHVALEPYMRRGRELRAEGVTGPDSFDVRHAEIEAGTLAMPREPTMVYNLGGAESMHDPVTGAVDEDYGRRVHAVYTPYLSEAASGLSTTPPQAGAPWIMRPGTPTSHIMVVMAPLKSEPQAEEAPD